MTDLDLFTAAARYPHRAGFKYSRAERHAGLMPVVERFMEKVEPEPNSGCWLWTASVTRFGYGHFKMGGRSVRAHRAGYELFRGPIPVDLHLDHLCRVRCCVNPDHLEPVSNRTNVLRGVGVCAAYSRQTHCKHGHSLTDSANVYHIPCKAVNRTCVTCKKLRRPAENLRARLKRRGLL